MAKPKQIILTEEGVITQKALLAYAEGRLGAAESAQLEKLLADDPFAQEALEGMRSAPAKAEMSTVITSLNMQLREKTGARERKKKGIEIHWANYAYAAVVLGVLVGFGYVMIHILASNNREMAENKNVPQAQESAPIIQAKKDTVKTDTLVNAEKHGTDSTVIAYGYAQDTGKFTANVSAATSTSTLTQSASPTFAASSAPTGTTTNQWSSVASGNSVSDVTALAKSKSASPAKAESDKSTANNYKLEEAKPAAPAMERKATDKLDKKDADVVSAQLLSAKTYFDSGDYINAEKKYKEVLTKMPNNLDALYFGGVSSYLNGTWGLGEGNFDKLIKAGAYTDGSKWYKANILIVKGQKDEAKKYLRDIINSGSIYKERAVKRYEELLK